MSQAIFVLGITQRSGTNFLYNLLKLHPDCFVAEPIWEDFLLKHTDKLKEYADNVMSSWDPEWGVGDEEKATLLSALGKGAQQFLEQRGSDNTKRLLTKTPDVTNLDSFFQFFPDAKLLVIVRDGRAVVESTINSFNSSFEQATKKWGDAADIIINFNQKHQQQSDKYQIIRYEDLYTNTGQELAKILDFLELDMESYPLEQAIDLPVSGSSNFRGSTGELNWDQVEKTEAFKPLDRFKDWNADQHQQFNAIGADMLSYFGYEPLILNEPEIQAAYNRVSRNAPCPCGSGKRFKACHGDLSASEALMPTSIEVDASTSSSLYCKVDTEVHLLSKETLLLLNKKSGKNVVMPEMAVRVLDEMTVYRTFDDHIKNSSLVSVIQHEDFYKLQNEFLQQGLLQSADELISSIKQSDLNTTLDDFGGIVIRTCERPDFLARLLTNLGDRTASNNEIIFILDDSRTSDSQQQNQRAVRHAEEKLSNQIIYIGNDWQHDFISKLSGVFPDQKETIQWLLQPKPAGHFSAGRLINLAILMLAGKRFITYDDDFLLATAKRREDSNQLNLKFCRQPEWSVTGYTTETDLLADGQFLDIDPIATHIETLGKYLGELYPSGYNFTLEEKAFSDLDALASYSIQPQSRILTTGNGNYGRPIAPNGCWIYTQNYKFTSPPWKQSQSYAAITTGEYIWKSAHHLSITTQTLSTPAGIDNSTLMPPTIPVGKSEDTLFGFLLKALYPDAIHLEFPWAIGHFREVRDWEKATFSTPVQMNLAALIWNHLVEIEAISGSSNVHDKCALIASSFLEWTSKPTQEINVDIQSWITEATANRIRLAQQQLDSLDPFDTNCRIDIERIIAINQTQLAQADQLPPIEDSTCPTGESVQIEWIKGEFRSFGLAMQIWPSLWDYCQANPTAVQGNNAT